MRQDKLSKTNLILYALGILPVIWLGVLFAPGLHGDLPEILENRTAAMAKPFSLSWCDATLKTVLILLRCYGIILCLTMIFVCSVTAFAADDPVAVVNNLSTFIFGLIRAVGLIILVFGIVQVVFSLKSNDPSQRANGFLTVAGGIVINFAKEILDLIVG